MDGESPEDDRTGAPEAGGRAGGATSPPPASRRSQAAARPAVTRRSRPGTAAPKRAPSPPGAGPARGAGSRAATATATREPRQRPPRDPGDGRRPSRRPVAARPEPGLYPRWVDLAICAWVFVLCGGDLPRIATNYSTHTATMWVLGAAGLPVLALRAWGRPLARSSSATTWAARCGVALIVVAGISSLLSPGFLLAMFGEYLVSSGFVFIVIILGAWAVGTAISGANRDWLERAIIAGALLNAAVAILQQFVGLNGIGLSDYYGFPDGVEGNPVFLGALLAGALALVGPRFVRSPGRWWAPTAALALGLGVCSERMPALLAVGVAAWVVGTQWRRRRAESRHWHGALGFAGVNVGSLVVGSLLAKAAGGTGVVSHAANSTASETFGQRFDIWKAVLQQFPQKPFFGWGPGMFQDALLPRYTPAFVRSAGYFTFQDAHDIFFGFLLTTGLLGVAALAAFLVFAVWDRRGPLAACGVVLLLSELIEPLNPVITPLMMLCLGAAPMTGRGLARPPWLRRPGHEPAGPPEPPDRAEPSPPPRWLQPLSAVLVVVVAVGSLLFLIGDIEYSHFSNVDGRLIGTEEVANHLFPFPQPALELAAIYFDQFTTSVSAHHPDQAAIKQAVAWAKVAVGRDPRDGALWAQLANYQGLAGELRAAHRSTAVAVTYAPYAIVALNDEALFAAEEGHSAKAEADWKLSLAIHRPQPKESQLLAALERGCSLLGGVERCPVVEHP